MLDAFFALLFPSLFGKTIDPEKLLQQPLRKRLVNLIERKPGIHASELCREAGEPWGTVQYHIDLLRKGELVQSHSTGRERCLFPGTTDETEAMQMAVLNQGRRPDIATLLLARPGLRQVDVCNTLGIGRKTFRSSMKALVDAGLIEERRGLQEVRYFPAEHLPDMLGESDAGYA